jgi:sugar lactone lactonase YvrE
MTEVVTAASQAAGADARAAHPGFEVYDPEFAAALGPAPRLTLVAETDTHEGPVPDGIKVDQAGHVYASSFSGVQVFSPAGDLIGLIRLPGAVNFTFGGPDGEVLFITTDTAIWAAVLNPAAGAGQRPDQKPGRW